MKCPFRMRALDHPDTCDPDCALLVSASYVERGGEWVEAYGCALVGEYTPINTYKPSEMGRVWREKRN